MSRRLLLLAAAAATALTGCGSPEPNVFGGEPLQPYGGRLVRGGQPVRFPPDAEVQLKCAYLAKGKFFGISIDPDGSFRVNIPSGKYSGQLFIRPANGKGNPINHTIPDGFEVKAGVSENVIEIGEGFQLPSAT